MTNEPQTENLSQNRQADVGRPQDTEAPTGPGAGFTAGRSYRGAFLLGALAVAIVSTLALLGWKATRAEGHDLAQRRQQVAQMSPVEREELLRRWQRFQALDPAEQDRLRRLHEQVQSDPDAERLERVMEHYHDWLTSLPPLRRSELVELEPQQRLESIRGLLAEQSRRQGQALSRQDATAVMRALEQYVVQQESQLLQALPEFQRRQLGSQLDKLTPAQRNRALLTLFFFRWQWGAPVQLPAPSAEALTQLRASLSADLQQRLDSKSPQEQWAMLTGGLRHLTREAEGRDLLFAVDEKELGRFFEEDLSEQQRDWLLSLPADDMQRELRHMYWMPLRTADGMFRPPDFSSKRPGHSESSKSRTRRGPGEGLPWMPRPPFPAEGDKSRRLLPGRLGEQMPAPAQSPAAKAPAP